MKKILLTMSAISMALLAIGCGGAANTGSNSSTAKANSSSPANASSASTPSSVDSTPMTVSINDLNDKKVDELQKLKGRTLVFKTEGLKAWSEDSLTASHVSRTVVCKGDFSSYKDAIKAFQGASSFVYVDFKGVVDEVEDKGSSIDLKLKDCSIQNVEK